MKISETEQWFIDHETPFFASKEKIEDAIDLGTRMLKAEGVADLYITTAFAILINTISRQIIKEHKSCKSKN